MTNAANTNLGDSGHWRVGSFAVCCFPVFAPGGGKDITARLIGQRLNEKLNQPFIVENRPGAGANIGMEAVAKAAPDGYTLLLVSPGAAINASLYEKLNYNFIRDIAPIAGIHRTPNVLAVHPSFPAKTLAEFVAGSGGNASGLAYRILESGYQLRIPRMFAALILISASGIAIFFATSSIAHLALRRWHESAVKREN